MLQPQLRLSPQLLFPHTDTCTQWFYERAPLVHRVVPHESNAASEATPAAGAGDNAASADTGAALLQSLAQQDDVAAGTLLEDAAKHSGGGGGGASGWDMSDVVVEEYEERDDVESAPPVVVSNAVCSVNVMDPGVPLSKAMATVQSWR